MKNQKSKAPIKQTQEQKAELVKELLTQLGIKNIDVPSLIALGNESDGKGESTKLNEFTLKKRVFIDAYIKTFGNATQAARMAKVTRHGFYYWMNHDPDFKEYIEGLRVEDIADDYNESQLMKRISEGSDACIIFRAKTKMKHRGYVERQEFVDATKKDNVIIYLPDNERDNYEEVSEQTDNTDG